MPRFPLRRHPHLYEINTYAWLEALSAKLGRSIRLADVPDSEWDAIARMGFDVVWLMGLWQRSPISRKLGQQAQSHYAGYSEALPGWTPDDIVGSPYSVRQYEPDARIGSWSDVDLARKKLHDREMALFLDFVGNHTALDHPWLRDHPEYYVQGAKEDLEREPANFREIDSADGPVYVAYGKDPYFPAWDDVAQLNHFSPGMRVAQLAELKKIAAHCDGVRCDMAMLQLNAIFERIWRAHIGDAKAPAKEFWTEAKSAVPDLIMLAEAYWGTEEQLIELGLDFVYDKGLYDSVRDERIGDIHWRISRPEAEQAHFARFLENHDEQRFANVFGDDRFKTVATLMGTLPGMRFYQQGEELGIKLRTPIELLRIADQPIDPARKQFFAKLLAATSDDVFHAGQWSSVQVTRDNEPTEDNLFVCEWRSGKLWKVVVINLSSGPAQGRVHLNDGIDPDSAYNFNDQLDGVRYVRQGAEIAQQGLFVRRDAYQAHLFDVTPVAAKRN
ncbi:MAG TPA: alpha-amylase family glycosyl hydrolase [Candidatus Acidoferrales bacterium]|nr:alpha-amylase family glycosyl hydrolase [Candidatus Acidoferrales bacterium]